MSKVDLIDRAALMEKLPEICDELNGCSAPYNFDEHCVGCEVYMLHKMLTDMPTLDVQPVRRGEWLVSEYEYLDCSECGEAMYTGCNSTKEAMVLKDHWMPFCPHCGANMRQEEHRP